MVSDKVTFLHKFIHNPKKTTSLSRAMLKTVNWDEIDSFVELGAGFGTITGSISERMKPGTRGLIIEQDCILRKKLIERFPQFYYRQQAEDLSSYLDELSINQVDCIFSKLPFVNFSASQRNRILEEVMKSLKPGGQFIVLQYSLDMRGVLLQYFASVRLCVIPLNLPPAFVYVCSKKKN
jgi:phospholipid N-methyltransferase